MDRPTTSQATQKGVLDLLFESLGHPVIVVDRKGGLVAVNPAASQLFGYEREEMIGQPFDMLLPPELRDQNETARIFEAGRVQNEEYICCSRAGIPVPFAMLAVAPPEAQNAVIILSLKPDSEHVMELQKELVRMQNLAMVGELAATVAHEVRNPLASILAAVENLRDELRLTGESADTVRRVISHVQRLDRTVEKLLIFARPWEPTLQEYDLSESLQSVLEQVRREPQAGGIQFDVKYPTPCQVVGDSQMTEHALVNILRNSVQALDGGGNIAVRVEGDEENLKITVEDDGPGIPVEHLATLFRPFFTTKAKGSGLGLAIAKKMVEGHGGGIRIESVPEKGTTAVITLPRSGR